MIILIQGVLLLILINFYFRLSTKFKIIDLPNNRSSHNTPTIRGGGIIIPIAILLYYLIFGFQTSYFVLGLLAISTISFLDDIKTLKNTTRIFTHLIAVSLLLYELNFTMYPWWLIILVIILVIGTINAVNFMDGINGITAAYAMVVIGSIAYISFYHITGIDQQLVWSILIALFVFAMYNFRTKARCFAGDVGSVSIAFILCYLITTLIITTNHIAFILLLAVYGVDTVLTIIQRLWSRENIFKAHRLHLYQYLVNEKGYSHLLIATVYAVLQLAINTLVIYNFQNHLLGNWMMILSVLIVLGGMYTLLKWNIHNKHFA